MIVKSKDSKQRNFKGVDFEVLTTGDKSMVTKMNYKRGDKGPVHSHHNERSGYVISGEYKIQYGQLSDNLKPGDSYCTPENVEHS